MTSTAAFVIAFVLAVNIISTPVHANWFGKRGDKDDIFSILLQQPQQDSLIATQELDAESALMAIESIIRAWRQQAEKLAKSRQG
jgi:hypothetical protein